jgi:hypothetical protein
MQDCRGGLRAPASMTDLKVSANIGMQVRHRMPPLSVLVNDYWTFCRFSRNFAAPSIDAI